MAKIIAVLLFSIFLFLSSVHFYWAFGGKWGTQGVYPTPDENTPPRNPGIFATLVVAIALFAFGVFYLIETKMINVELSPDFSEKGFWLLSITFALRALGDFKYFGFFKKIKNTKFGQNDTKYFTPLCLIISILSVVLMLLN